MFPRYFVALSDPVPVGAFHPVNAQVLDVFRWRGAEMAVIRDLRGDLHLFDGPFENLPVSLRSVIHGHELAVGGYRTVVAESLWLLDVEAMEQLPDTPGTNDPIYMTGRLSGPWPGEPTAANGRLAITRADLLAGLTAGEPFAIRGEGGRCLHAALPGGRTEEIALGKGYVLAFALVPLEIQPSDPSNEGVAAQLIHDVLGALRVDLQAAKIAHWLLRESLPVPNRAALEAHLVSDGWKIRGNAAVHPFGPRPGFSGFLHMALGIDYDRKIMLPKEAPLSAFLSLASRMLASFPDFPDERASALARRVEVAGRVAPVAVPVPGPVGLTAAIQLPPRPTGERDEWEAQFRRAATSPGLGTRVTPVR